MKTKLVFLMLISWMLSSLCVAQTNYRSYFGEEFTRWYAYFSFIEGRWSNLIEVEKTDTILSNGINYKNAYFSEAYWTAGGSWWAGIREDTITGSLYIKKNEGDEVLVSRMNLAVRDTFYFSKDVRLDYFSPVYENEKGRYTLVDSIYFKDGRKHVRCEALHTQYGYPLVDLRLTFIEGIGPNVSFGPLIDYDNFTVGFICYETETGLWKAEILRFDGMPIRIDECLFWYVSIPDINPEDSFSVIYREGEVELQFKHLSNDAVIRIYSMQGQLMRAIETKGKQNFIIANSGFYPGYYIVQVEDPGSKKIKGQKIHLGN